jgi:hypothetical protein
LLYLSRLGLHFDTITGSSFFYLMTAARALHIAAGLAALLAAEQRLR